MGTDTILLRYAYSRPYLLKHKLQACTVMRTNCYQQETLFLESVFIPILQWLYALSNATCIYHLLLNIGPTHLSLYRLLLV